MGEIKASMSIFAFCYFA